MIRLLLKVQDAGLGAEFSWNGAALNNMLHPSFHNTFFPRVLFKSLHLTWAVQFIFSRRVDINFS